MILDSLSYFKQPSVKRHVAQTISWRVVGTLDTIVLSWIITGSPVISLKIGGCELLTKMALYFIHERVWFRINLGLPHRIADEETKK
jgi:uncharacterized membrane protein